MDLIQINSDSNRAVTSRHTEFQLLYGAFRPGSMASNGGRYTTEHYPSSADAGRSIVQNGFKITTRKLPILKAKPIEEMTEALGIAPPEMIFGDNSVTIRHNDSGFGISFNTFDALDRVDKTGDSMLQVAHSREWQSTRYEEHGITY